MEGALPCVPSGLEPELQLRPLRLPGKLTPLGFAAFTEMMQSGVQDPFARRRRGKIQQPCCEEEGESTKVHRFFLAVRSRLSATLPSGLPSFPSAGNGGTDTL